MVLPLDACSGQKDQVDESMQDSFKQTKELIVVDKIKIFPRQIRRGKNTASKYNFLQGKRDGVN